MEVTLFHFEREDIRIDIVARFEGDLLIIDGYDVGKTVNDYWGDSDYEYGMRIGPPGIYLLYDELKVAHDEKQQLLNTLAATYNTNHCYSQLEKLVDTLNIPHESFKWT